MSVHACIMMILCSVFHLYALFSGGCWCRGTSSALLGRGHQVCFRAQDDGHGERIFCFVRFVRFVLNFPRQQIYNHQAIQMMLADMATGIEASRLLVHKSGWLVRSMRGRSGSECVGW